MKKFKIKNAVRKPNRCCIKNPGDYCVTVGGHIIMACPACGQIAVINAHPRNKCENIEPLTIKGPFQFPCQAFHAFWIERGKIQSSNWTWEKRVPIKGFDN